MLAVPFRAGVFAVLLSAVAPFAARAADENAAEVEARLLQAVKYLSSDELEGRGVGTKGIDVAADYLAAEFGKMGLKTAVFEGQPFQRFKLTTSTQLGPAEKNRLKFVGPTAGGATPSLDFKLSDGFTPLALGGSGAFNGEIVFAGYGITAPEQSYDDYAGVDAKGKAVIVLRHHPRFKDPHSPFAGRRGPGRHATFDTKVSNAYQHGASLVILVNDEAEIRDQIAQHRKRWQASIDALAAASKKLSAIAEPTVEQLESNRREVERLADEVKSHGKRLQEQYDPLLAFDRAGVDNGGRPMPVVFCTRQAIDKVLAATIGVGLATLEQRIDNLAGASTEKSPSGPAPPEPSEPQPAHGSQPKPHSLALGAWRADGEVNVVRNESDVRNVAAVLEGEGPRAEETIVIGAHYDHLGTAGQGSLASPENRKLIHNGADDNASGTVALVEIARRLAARPKKLPRRVMFMAFTGEERGLLGSAHYVGKPAIPLDKTVAMLNLDMVGRLKDNKLIIQGADTASEFTPMINELNKAYTFAITHQAGGFGPSDHASFYGKRVPVMHFFTGTHEDYHRPSDDAEKLNLEGMRRIVDLVTDSAVRIAESDARPTYLEAKQPRGDRGGPRGDRPYFGSIPDFSQTGTGFAISGVAKEGPAGRAGLKGGDVIIQLGDNKIANLEDFDTALRKFKAGDKVPVCVKRGSETVTIDVTLDPPR